MLRAGHAKFGGAVANLGQDCSRHLKELAKFRAPGVGMNVEQQRARCIGGIGRVHLAAGQAPEQKAIDGAEGEFATLGQIARAGHMVEQPGNLGGREIRVRQQAGARGDVGLMAGIFKPLAFVGGAPVLPDDRIVNRFSGFPVPDDGRFALVGDADRGDLPGRHPGPGDGLSAGLKHRAPEILRIVLDPAGARKMLRKFLLGGGGDSAIAPKDHRARRRGALVNRENVSRHSMSRYVTTRFGFGVR